MSVRDDEINELLARWTAAEAAGDTTALDECLADDFIGVGPLGFMLSKQEWLDRHAPGELKYDSVELEETRLREYGDAAVVTARLNQPGTYRGHPIPGSPRATLVLVSQSGAWRLASIHLSFIAGTPGAPPVPGRP